MFETVGMMVFVESDNRDKAEEIWSVLDRSLTGLQWRQTLLDDDPRYDWIGIYVGLAENPSESAIEAALTNFRKEAGTLVREVTHTSICAPASRK